MIRGTTRLTAVVGWPVDHSRSPQMLNAAFAATSIDAVMVPLGVEPDEFMCVVAGLRAARALGASVTVPHKVVAVAACSELSPAALAIGAVNCLQLIDDRVVGHNTDCDGFLDGLVSGGFDRAALPITRVVVLGAGGAARAVTYGLRAAGSIRLIARRPEVADWFKARSDGSRRLLAWTASNIHDAFANSDLVVDCTPIGLGGADEASLVDALPIDILPRGTRVASLVYHRPTLLLERARSAGHAVIDGRAMLVHQGARAFTIWTRRPAPVEVMQNALDDALRSGT